MKRIKRLIVVIIALISIPVLGNIRKTLEDIEKRIENSRENILEIDIESLKNYMTWCEKGEGLLKKGIGILEKKISATTTTQTTISFDQEWENWLSLEGDFKSLEDKKKYLYSLIERMDILKRDIQIEIEKRRFFSKKQLPFLSFGIGVIIEKNKEKTKEGMEGTRTLDSSLCGEIGLRLPFSEWTGIMIYPGIGKDGVYCGIEGFYPLIYPDQKNFYGSWILIGATNVVPSGGLSLGFSLEQFEVKSKLWARVIFFSSGSIFQIGGSKIF